MSQANYIVICTGRTAFSAAPKSVEKIVALSNVAAALVTHIDIMHPSELTEDDTKPISDLQHFLMDNMHKLSRREVDEKAVEMFGMLDALEDKFP